MYFEFCGTAKKNNNPWGLVSFNNNREKSEYESSSEEAMRGTYVSHDDLKAFPRERERE